MTDYVVFFIIVGVLYFVRIEWEWPILHVRFRLPLPEFSMAWAKVWIVGAIIVLVSTVPVHAQDCPPWWFGCYQQPYQPQRQPISEPRHHTTRPVVHHREREYREPKPTSKPTIQYRTKTVTITKTWQSMSQDDARQWIKDQASSFCGKYPKDMACVELKKE